MAVSVCAFCGTRVGSDTALCGHHELPYEQGWAASNRVMCDFFHRGREPNRLGPDDRERPAWNIRDVEDRPCR